MSTAPTLLRAALAAAALLAGGCQTFIGIEDVQSHLPRIEGDYLLGLQRARSSDNSMEKIRMIGSVELDADAREFDLSFSILATDADTVLSENSLTNLVFPDGASEVEFDLSIAIPMGAEERPITDVDDRNVDARMVLRLEGDYAFCAEQIEPLPPTTSIGSILLAPGGAHPAGAYDVDCDDLQ